MAEPVYDQARKDIADACSEMFEKVKKQLEEKLGLDEDSDVVHEMEVSLFDWCEHCLQPMLLPPKQKSDERCSNCGEIATIPLELK